MYSRCHFSNSAWPASSKELFEEGPAKQYDKVCQTLADAEATLEHYLARDGTKGFIEPSDDQFRCIVNPTKKVLKSVRYSAANPQDHILNR